jgi:hypothetical protein
VNEEYLVKDLSNALPGNSSVNTVQHVTINEAVFSMSSAPNSCGTTGLCNPSSLVREGAPQNKTVIVKE